MTKTKTTKTTKAKAPKSVKRTVKVGSTFRVYRLPKSLRIECAKARTARDQTVARFTEQAVNEELAGIVGDLRVLLHGKHPGPKGPVRLPVADSTLAQLKDASRMGLPASLLLELALGRASAKAVNGRSRKATRKAK